MKGLVGLLLVLSGNLLIDALEVSTTIVVLPALSADLRLAPATAQWSLSAFALGFGALLPFSNRMAARFGARRIYLAALAMFAAASLAGGLTDDAAVLMVSRFVKGLCVACTAPTGLAIIATAFPEGPARSRAMTVYSLFGASGFCTGLVAAGLLTEVSWRWTLLFPLPVAVVLFAFGFALIPDAGSGSSGAGRPSLADELLSTIRAARRPLAVAALGAAALNGPFWAFLFLLTFRLQSQAGWSPFQAGLALLPTGLPLALTVPWSARLIQRFGPRRLICAGATAPPAGYVLYMLHGGHSTYLTGILPTLLLVGAGFVGAFTALHVRATAAVAERERRTVSALYQSVVQIGGAVTLTVAVALLPSHEALAPANSQEVLVLLASLSASGLVLAVWDLRPERRPVGTLPRTPQKGQ
ncbi:MFS transporter [Nonomuraea polychroma]|uniref:MFS transporter n=1 Tax=Nonomuraea polychroma TaxID=46176 RepID=UPI003D8C96A7